MKKLGSLFTGIGAFEEALRQLKIEYHSSFSCDNGEIYFDESFDELNKMAAKEGIAPNKLVDRLYDEHKKKNNVKISFLRNHKTDKWFNDVRFFDAKPYGNNLDLIVGGSPCQSFSHIGKRGGIEDARGTLFYEYIRVLKESMPKWFIYENVVGITTIDKGKTWKRMQEMFGDLGYNYKVMKLNAKDFNLPQSRNRIFVVGTLAHSNELEVPKKIPLKKTVSDYYEKKVDDKYYLGKKGFEFVTNPKYINRARVNAPVMLCQKANQQFNWNGDFVFEKTKRFEGHDRIYTSTWNGDVGVIRKLTPKETIKLMGFKNFKLPLGVNDTQLYRQSGNSIAVPVLKAIIKETMKW